MYWMRSYLRLLPAMLLLVLMASCAGSGSSGSLINANGLDGLAGNPAEESHSASAGFELTVLPESFYGGATASLNLEVIEQEEQVIVELHAADAEALKALYFELEYDSTSFRPVEASPASGFGGTEELLTLTIAQEQGVLHHGQVLIHPQKQNGFSGDGVVATVRFARESDPLRRLAASAPVSDASAAQLTLDEENGRLVWGFTSQGDYDQNSETNIADLTPLGVHFQTGGGPFEYYTVEAVVDGDGNGEINIADITPIGINFKRRVNGYNVYHSDTPETDYPQSNSDAAVVAHIASLGYQAFEGNAGNERLRYYFELVGQPQNTTYWVRPVDSESLGTPSPALLVPFLTAPIPTVSVTATPDSGFVPLDVDFDASGSTSPVGVLTDYEWDFDNDGVFNESDNGEDLAQGSPTASFTFTTPGTYDVVVRATNQFAFSGTGGVSVSANLAPNVAPTATISASPLSGKAPLNITFDASGSSDSDGSIVEYEWDFDGDGIYDQSTGAVDNVQHVFNNAGNFDVRVRVTDNDGASDVAMISENGNGTITIQPANEAPVASITADVTDGQLPLTVNFDAGGSTDSDGTITGYEWDFEGDGIFEFNSGLDATVSHLYESAGNYDPAVRVTDNDDATDTASLSDTVAGGITINSPPVAAISADVTSGALPLQVNFDASASTDSDGTIVNYQWDFDGDGIWDLDTGNSPNTLFIYNEAGDYDPKVMVTDNDGASDVASLSDTVIGGITVNDPPVAAITADTMSGPVPLLVNFDASGSTDSDGTVVNYEWDFEGDGIYDLDTDGTATAQFTFTTGGEYDPTVRVTDNEGAVDTASISEAGSGEIVVTDGPAASLTADPTSGDAPLAVAFDASASTGDNLTFEWDFFNDGTFELNTGSTATANYVYGQIGTHTATVRITDDQAQTDTASIEITLESGWDSSTSILTIVMDSKASIETFADGDENARLALAFKDAAEDDLLFVRSSDATGFSWDSAITVLSSGQVGNDCTLRDINGFPGISFRRAASKLDYIQSTETDGSDWPTDSVEVDGGGGAGAFTALAVVNGNPAVSNIKSGSDDLRFARATSAAGTTWNAPQDIEATLGGGDEIEFTDLEVVNGNPAMLYNYVGGGSTGLKFVRATDASGSAFSASVQVNAPVAGGRYPSLQVVDGNPAASYQAFSVDELRYKRSDDANGAVWSSHVVVDSGADIGEWTTLRIVDGMPAIAYYEPDGANLKFALGNDAQGTSFSTMYVDIEGSVGKFATMTVINGQPAIAYYDETNTALKIAVFVPAAP